jgi:hypothetical protein
MDDPKTFWLTLTNIALGLAVALPVLGVATGILCEFVARLRRRHTIWNDLDKELLNRILVSGPMSRTRHSVLLNAPAVFTWRLKRDPPELPPNGTPSRARAKWIGFR